MDLSERTSQLPAPAITRATGAEDPDDDPKRLSRFTPLRYPLDDDFV